MAALDAPRPPRPLTSASLRRWRAWELTTLVTAGVLLPALARLVPGERWTARAGEAVPGEEREAAEAGGGDRRRPG